MYSVYVRLKSIENWNWNIQFWVRKSTSCLIGLQVRLWLKLLMILWTVTWSINFTMHILKSKVMRQKAKMIHFFHFDNISTIDFQLQHCNCYYWFQTQAEENFANSLLMGKIEPTHNKMPQQPEEPERQETSAGGKIMGILIFIVSMILIICTMPLSLCMCVKMVSVSTWSPLRPFKVI